MNRPSRFLLSALGGVALLVLFQSAGAADRPLASRPAVTLPVEDLASVEGTYRLAARGADLYFRRDGGRLYAWATGEPRSEVRPLARDTFASRAAGTWHTFERDTQGRVVGLTFHQNGRATFAPRTGA